MFHNIPPSISERMRYLEAIDTQDRQDGTPRLQRLRQIPPETGRFLALIAAAAPAGEYLEIGTSAGYSTLWISLACQLLNRKVITFEVLPEKILLARETFKLAGVESYVELVAGDAREHILGYENIAFCFLDAEKEVYDEVYDLMIPRMARGGFLVADNAVNHREALQPVLDKALHDPRVDALIVPIGKGELVCRKL